jgi:hypothetical protein
MTLDQFVDELIRRAAAHRYFPTTFMRMRTQYGTVSAIRKLVETSKPQSGFRRLKQLGMLEWTLESAVLAYPHQFPATTIKFARARLDGTLDT